MVNKITVIFIYLDNLFSISEENKSAGVELKESIVLQASLVNFSGSLFTDYFKVCFHFKGLFFMRRDPINCHCLVILLSSYSFKPLESSS